MCHDDDDSEDGEDMMKKLSEQLMSQIPNNMNINESVPEEVYCKALEVLETNPNDADTIDIGEYNIDFYNSFSLFSHSYMY